MSDRRIISSFRKVKWLYGLNARGKAAWTKRLYCKTSAYYKDKIQKKSFDELLQGRLGNRLDRIRRLDGPMNIFFLGTDEAQDRAGRIAAADTAVVKSLTHTLDQMKHPFD